MRPTMPSSRRLKPRQTGAVIVTVAFTMLFLLGFMGIALDFGHLFIVKTELQTATDSCALAAAQELDGASDALTRATSAGMTAGNLNRTNFQGGAAGIVAADITFSDALNGAYSSTFAPVANARYARCTRTRNGMLPWMLQAMGAFSGNAAYGATQGVQAIGIATRASAQSTCPVPLGLKPKPGGAAPNYGFVPGEWVTLLHQQNAAVGGQIGWMNLDGSNNASETEAEMNGRCGTRVGDTLGTPGVQASIADAWNSRFGIYKNSSGPSQPNGTPDYTGYSYTATNWPSQQNAFKGSPTANNFVAKRAAFAACAPSGRVKGANSCESITGLSLNGGFQTLATGGPTGEHHNFGANRRIVTIPVVSAASKVIDYACMLMLHPMPIPMADVKLEFIGNANELNSPCTTNGLPGGTTGPRVPVLVQ
jgi:hypothetical protein